MKMRRLYYPSLFLRRRFIRVAIFSVFLTVAYYFGAFTHIFETDYSLFSYPLELDVTTLVESLKNNEKPSVLPINVYNYSYISDCSSKCISTGEQLRVVYIVKSAVNNFERRMAIRDTWGYEKRFSDVPIRTVFILGIQPDPAIQVRVQEENEKYNDIVQADFVDSYFNNTIKTMIGFKWAVTFCKNSKFYFFSDDDMYVSTKNILRFLRNPTQYPEYLEIPVVSIQKLKEGKDGQKEIPVKHPVYYVGDYELPDGVKLFAGYVFVSSPHRHRTSKWYVPLSEYPYHMWPPYVTAGAYVISQAALVDMYYASFYIKHFRFDDIYLAIVAKKIGIEPFHCDEFYFYKKNYNVYNYHYVIASHGYGSPSELRNVWNEQKSAGNA